MADTNSIFFVSNPDPVYSFLSNTPSQQAFQQGGAAAVNTVPATESMPPTLQPNKTFSTIDVVNDFYWTYSKQGNPNRLEVPYIILREKRLKTNSIISQIKSSFGASLEGGERVLNYLKSNSSIARGIADSSFVKTLAGLASKATTSGVNAAQTATSNSQILQEINNISDDNNFLMEDPLLRAYKDLYITEPTGFSYILPYFEDYVNGSANQFGEDAAASPLQSIAAGIKGFADIAGIAQRPFGFSFQERAKFYNFPQTGEAITVNFPLINTGSATFEDVIKNWQFIFLLLYQNKPSRLNRTVVEPPVIYQVEIPGQKFLPYCYISELQVTFKGSRRTVKFTLPQKNSIFVTPTTTNKTAALPQNQVISEQVTYTDKNVDAIIPDAYQIRIVLQSLVADTKNFMAYSYNLAANQNIVNVTEKNAQAAFDYISNNSAQPVNTSSTEAAR